MTLVVVAVASSLIAAAATQDYTDYQESQKNIAARWLGPFIVHREILS